MLAIHGKYTIGKKKRILVVDATGPRNLEAARYFDRVIRRSVLEWFRPDLPRAMIALLHGEGVYTEESTPILSELHRWRVERGYRT